MSDTAAAVPSKPKVLVADDEQVIANTLAIILNQAGFEARAVYSGEKAIESLDTFEPDMLISDVIMTGMTGIEAAIATRAKRPNCKILLFSGQAATADLLEKARAQGHEFEILAKLQIFRRHGRHPQHSPFSHLDARRDTRPRANPRICTNLHLISKERKGRVVEVMSRPA
jgi:CheY-like chemotaxis protein